MIQYISSSYSEKKIETCKLVVFFPDAMLCKYGLSLPTRNLELRVLVNMFVFKFKLSPKKFHVSDPVVYAD